MECALLQQHWQKKMRLEQNKSGIVTDVAVNCVADRFVDAVSLQRNVRGGRRRQEMLTFRIARSCACSGEAN